MGRERGQAVLLVVVVTLALQVIAWAFLARMHAAQRLAGGSTRSLAALYLAEAGLQQALRRLEDRVDSEAGADGQPLPYAAALGRGTFTIEEIAPGPDDRVAVTVRGEVAGAVRRVRALVALGPAVLDHGLSARDGVVLGRGSQTFVVMGRRGWGQPGAGPTIVAGGEVHIEDASARVNGVPQTGVPTGAVAPADRALLAAGVLSGALPPVRLVLLGGAALRVGSTTVPAELAALHTRGVGQGLAAVVERPALPFPVYDGARVRTLAEANTRNAALNARAAAATGHPDLRRKAHSRYSAEEFRILVNTLRGPDGRGPVLHGPIVVDGPLELDAPGRLTVLDGALVVAGDVLVGEGVLLEVRRDPAAGLPGLATLAVPPGQPGALVLDPGAAVVVDGLVLTEGPLELQRGTLAVRGAVLTRRLASHEGLLTITYTARVLATAGWRVVPGARRAEVLSWQEVP